MLMKQPIGRGRVYDLLHRGGVITCMTVTVAGLIGTAILVSNKLQHSVTRPETVGENFDSEEKVENLQ